MSDSVICRSSRVIADEKRVCQDLWIKTYASTSSVRTQDFVKRGNTHGEASGKSSSKSTLEATIRTVLAPGKVERA